MENFALNTIFVFVFIVFPGIVFNRIYYSGRFNYKTSIISITTLVMSIVPGIFIQYVTFFTFKKFFSDKPTFKIDELNNLYQNLSENKLPSYLFELSTIKWIGFYCLILIIISFLFSTFLRILVRGFHLDKYIEILRFENQWHYYLSGEAIKFKEFKNTLTKNLGKKYVKVVIADVLVKCNEKNILYKGIVHKHTITKSENKLENLFLTNTEISIFSDNYVENSKDLKELPGDIFIIPSENIININLTYFYENKNKKDLSLLIGMITITVIILLITDVFNIFFEKSLLFKIAGKIILFFDYVFVAMLIDVLYSRKYIQEKKEQLENDNAIIGLVFFLVLLSILTYVFFK